MYCISKQSFRSIKEIQILLNNQRIKSKDLKEYTNHDLVMKQKIVCTYCDIVRIVIKTIIEFKAMLF